MWMIRPKRMMLEWGVTTASGALLVFKSEVAAQLYLMGISCNPDIHEIVEVEICEVDATMQEAALL